MTNLKQIGALILLFIFYSCNDESLIEGRLPVEGVYDGPQTENVVFAVDGVFYVGGPLVLENQSNSFCVSHVVASSYNSEATKGIGIVDYQQTSANIFDYFFVNQCSQMRVYIQIDNTFYFSTAGTYTVSGDTFTINCNAVSQVAGGQLGTTSHTIFATGKIM